MVSRAGQILMLERIARLKFEIELKKLSVFQEHMTVARDRVETLQSDLRRCYDASAPLSVAELRSANAQAGRAARELRAAQANLEQLTPRFQMMHGRALKEFGRASVMAEISDKLRIQEATKKSGCHEH